MSNKGLSSKEQLSSDTIADTEQIKECFNMSDREWWWRRMLRETPKPGSYNALTFVDELQAEKIPKSYGFKSEGRKRNADPSRKGTYLMPGLYDKKDDLVDILKRKNMSYNFKSIHRGNTAGVVTGMEDLSMKRSQVGPATYNLDSKPVDTFLVKQPVFKSQSRRFPTIYFVPKEGPAPGFYESYKQSEVNNCLKATAPFKSKTPRFLKPQLQRTPGPGTYTKMSQTPMPSHIRQLGRYHGLFFPPGVY